MTKKIYQYKSKLGINYNVVVIKEYYDNDMIKLSLFDPEDGSPVLVATKVLPGFDVPEGYTVIKDYSENEGVLDFLIDNHITGPVELIIVPTNSFVSFSMVKVLI